MSSNPIVRSSEKQPNTISRVNSVYIDDLKKLKVVIRRHNITDPDPSKIIQRNLENPAELKIHFRPDEGLRPIFERDDVHVNKEASDEKLIFIKENRRSRSSSSSVSSRLSITHRDDSNRRYNNSPIRQEHKKYDSFNRQRSPTKQLERHTSRRRNSKSPNNYNQRNYNSYNKSKDDYHRKMPDRRSKSPMKLPEKSRRNYSRSPGPGRYENSRRHSTSPPSKYKSSSTKSPPRYKELRRSRSPLQRPPPPPSSSSIRRRSRDSRSPSHRDLSSRSRRYSRTPPRSDYRKYERSRRSRTPPRREHRTPERYVSSRHRRSRSRSRSRDEKRYNPSSTSTHVPPEYGFYEGNEYWISAPMPPRFIPRSYLPPPGAFPRGLPGHPILVPRMPMIIPSHPQFRPRLPVYNSKHLKGKTASVTTGAVSAGAAAATTTTASSSSTVTITEITGDSPSTSKEVIEVADEKKKNSQHSICKTEDDSENTS